MWYSKVPGKLIISGEHAVVYGNPALAIALKQSLSIELTVLEQPTICWQLNGQPQQLQLAIEDLMPRYQQLCQRYANYLKGRLSAAVLCDTPEDLPLYTLGLWLTHYGLTLEHGLQFSVHSELPIGCGLGSSAAVVVGMLQVLSQYFGMPIEHHALLSLAVQAENIRHGRSSGLDPSVCLYQCPLLFQQGQASLRKYPPQQVSLVNTGQSQSSTAECVAAAKVQMNSVLLERFAQVTSQCDQALQQQHDESFRKAIMINHQLLCELGVVPKSVQTLIQRLQQRDYVAKICGAGTVSGQQAGYMMIYPAMPNRHILDELSAELPNLSLTHHWQQQL